MNNKKKSDRKPRPYDTYPLTSEESRDKDTNMTIPTEEGVKEAKDWVDHNQK